jgi:hypothetical protein
MDKVHKHSKSECYTPSSEALIWTSCSLLVTQGHFWRTQRSQYSGSNSEPSKFRCQNITSNNWLHLSHESLMYFRRACWKVNRARIWKIRPRGHCIISRYVCTRISWQPSCGYNLRKDPWTRSSCYRFQISEPCHVCKGAVCCFFFCHHFCPANNSIDKDVKIFCLN